MIMLARSLRDSAVSLESGTGDPWSVGETAMRENMGASLASSTAVQYGRIWARFGKFCASTKVIIL